MKLSKSFLPDLRQEADFPDRARDTKEFKINCSIKN